MTQSIRRGEQSGHSDRALPRVQFYIAFTERVRVSDDPVQDLKELLPAHLDWVRSLEDSGVLFMAGPFRDDDYWEGDGMFVLKTRSKAEAEALAATCPLHKSGKRRFRVVPWQFNEGSITLTVKQVRGTFDWF